MKNAIDAAAATINAATSNNNNNNNNNKAVERGIWVLRTMALQDSRTSFF